MVAALLEVLPGLAFAAPTQGDLHFASPLSRSWIYPDFDLCMDLHPEYKSLLVFGQPGVHKDLMIVTMLSCKQAYRDLLSK